MDDIETIKQQIQKAQEWAKVYFNADNAKNRRLVDEDFNFLKPSFFVEFPQSDIMWVFPSGRGQKLGIKTTYRLAFVGENGLRWKFQKMEIDDIEVPKELHRPIADLDVR